MTNVNRQIEAFILEAPRTMTYSELEAAVRERFGASGWTAERIAEFWTARSEVRACRLGLLDRDGEVRRFVDDRLFRMTLDEMLEACRSVFGDARTPSRSALHRYSQRVRHAREAACSPKVV